MIKKTGLAAFSMLFSLPLVSASGFNLNDGGLNIKELTSGMDVPAVSAAPAAKAQAEWTVMVFINGKNNLEPYAVMDMNEMEAVGSTDKLNIVVEIGRLAGRRAAAVSGDDWEGTRRYLIKKDADMDKLSSEMIADMGTVDMGDYKNLAAFGKWAKQAYPAKKYMLIVWNHGSGWEKGLKSRVSKGISYDDQSGNHINTPQLGQALKEMGHVDVYGSDACLMQMPEVDYELKDYADYIVGSEETEPGDGYTYNKFLAPVAANPAMSPAELAKTAVDAYSDHYAAQKTGSTQSFVKTAALPGLVQRVNDWTKAVMAAGLKTEVNNARELSASYAVAENKDLYHFVRLVSDRTQDPALKARSEDLMKFISGELVMHNRTNNQPGSSGGWDGGWDEDYMMAGKGSRWGAKDYSESHGIAVYLPGYSMGEGYNELAWAAASNWDEFIAWYMKK